MALTGTLTYDTTLVFQDRDKNTASVSARFDSALTASGLETELLALGAAIAAVVDSVLVAISYTRTLQEIDQTVLNSAPETSDVERKGVFVFNTSYGTNSKMELPSIKNTLVVDGSNIINMADAAVIAFLAAVAPGTPGAASPLDPAGGTLTFSGTAAHKMHRKSSKG